MNRRHKCIDRETAKWGAKKIIMIIGFTILGIGLCILLGFVLMWLWNWLMPIIFNLPEITYWQAVGLFILAKVLFGAFGGEYSDDSDKHHRTNRRFKGPIRTKIKYEVGKEIDKEIDKEFDKYEGNNQDYDELYEKWWEEKGEKSFNEYMKSKNADDEKI